MLADPGDPGLYVSTRMVPPGTQIYYFSIGDKKIAAKGQKVVPNIKPEFIEFQRLQSDY